MENKINIAELLKDCPKGMELDCTIWDNVVFDHIDTTSNYPIYIKKMEGELEYLTEDGHFNFDCDAKCVIFPKGKTTWEGFVPPCKFKTGDVLFVDCSDDEDKSYQYIFILNDPEFYGKWHSYCHLDGVGCFCSEETYLTDDEYHPRFATKEEKQKLFDAIKANGYKWNPETKTLEELYKFKVGDRIKNKNVNLYHTVNRILGGSYIVDNNLVLDMNMEHLYELALDIKPKFNVGDRVKKNKDYISGIITDIFDDSFKVTYDGGGCSYVQFHYQDDWELVPEKFDISTLKPFDKVLVRDNNEQFWTCDWFSFHDTKQVYPFACVGHYVSQCIPYEENQHLLGTTNDCDNFFKTW